MSGYFDEVVVLFDEELREEEKFRQKEVAKKKKEMETLRKKEEKIFMKDLKKLKSLKREEEERIHLEFKAKQRRLQDKHTKEILALQKIENKLERLQRQCSQMSRETQTDTSREYSWDKLCPLHKSNQKNKSVLLLKNVPHDTKILEAKKIDSLLNKIHLKNEDSSLSNKIISKMPYGSEKDLEINEDDDIKLSQISIENSDSFKEPLKSKDEMKNSSLKTLESTPDYTSFGNVKKSIEKWNSILDSRTIIRNLDEEKNKSQNDEEKKTKTNHCVTLGGKLCGEKDSFDKKLYNGTNLSSNWKKYLGPFSSSFIDNHEESSMKFKPRVSDAQFSSSKLICEPEISKGEAKNTTIDSQDQSSQSNNNNGNAMELTITCGCNISTLKILTPKNSSLQLSRPNERQCWSCPLRSNSEINLDLENNQTNSNRRSLYFPGSDLNASKKSYPKTKKNSLSCSYNSEVQSLTESNPLTTSSLNDSFQMLSLQKADKTNKSTLEMKFCDCKGGNLGIKRESSNSFKTGSVGGTDEYEYLEPNEEHELNSTFTLDEKDGKIVVL